MAQLAAGERSRAPSPAGYGASEVRWPAEWEPHEATWLSWPHNRETWPGCLSEAEAAFVEIVRALQGREQVRINVADAAMEAHARSRLEAGGVDPDRGVAFFHHPTDDAWVRDHGPFFVERAGEKLLLDFGYDAWGGKYPPWELDDAVPARIARALGCASEVPGFVLEGGSVDGDGQGTVLTTTTCLLSEARRRPGEPRRTREEMERRMAEWLGARHVVWLEGEIAGDDTDGHVDDLARFVSPGVVVTAEAPADHPDSRVLAASRALLEKAHDARGRALEVATIPMPPQARHRGTVCPATYVNFYLANRVALVPTFGVREDARALDALRELLPGRELVPIPASALVVGLGGVHCLTREEPMASGPALSSAPSIR